MYKADRRIVPMQSGGTARGVPLQSVVGKYLCRVEVEQGSTGHISLCSPGRGGHSHHWVAPHCWQKRLDAKGETQGICKNCDRSSLIESMF